LCLKFNLEAGHNSTGRLHPEIYISLGHKHFAPGNRDAEKEGFILGRFRGSWGGDFCAEYSILRPAFNPTGKLHPEKYISLGHKRLAPGNSY
jgi:hypothetical protein